MDKLPSRSWSATTALVLLFSLGGVASIFFPWIEVKYFGDLPGKFFQVIHANMDNLRLIDRSGSGLFRGDMGKLEGRLGNKNWNKKEYNGLVDWEGVPTGILFVLVFLLALATSPLHPAPLWRSILLAVAGGLVLLFAGILCGQYMNHPIANLMIGVYLALGMGFGLLLCSALEIRGRIIWKANRRLAGSVPMEIAEAVKRDVRERPPSWDVPEVKEEDRGPRGDV